MDWNFNIRDMPIDKNIEVIKLDGGQHIGIRPYGHDDFHYMSTKTDCVEFLEFNNIRAWRLVKFSDPPDEFEMLLRKWAGNYAAYNLKTYDITKSFYDFLKAEGRLK